MLVLSCLQACAVGVMKVEGPQLLTDKLVSMNREVYFEVCAPPEFKNSAWSKVMGEKIKSILQRDFAVDAHNGVPSVNRPFFHFLFIPKQDYLYMPFMAISVATFGILPGYGVGRTIIDMPFTAKDANGEIIQERYKYEQRNRYFLWLPLIFYPDIVATLNGAYVNKDKEDLGLELVLNRFIHDASERMNQPSNDPMIMDMPLVSKCPDP